MVQYAPLPSTMDNGARSLAGARPVGAKGPNRWMRANWRTRGLRMHSTLCAAAAFQHATAYAAEGLQNSMLGLTAPGDGSGKLQSTPPLGSGITR